MKTKKTILVTGSSGLIGYPIVKKLLNSEVYILGIDPRELSEKNRQYTHLSNINLSKDKFLEVFEKYNVSDVIHTGGISGPMLFNDQPFKIIKNNIFFTLNLIEACRAFNKINKVIFCSSISAYGDLFEKNTDENFKFSPTNLYGASKASCDLILEKYFENYNLDILALRFSTIYGPRRETDCFIKDMVNAAKSNKKITLPFRKDLQWPYIHVDDAVSSIIAALLNEKKSNYSYNISGPDFPSYGQVANEIKTYYKNFNPSFSKSNHIKKRELFSIEKIKKEINWIPKISIKKGIKTFVI